MQISTDVDEPRTARALRSSDFGPPASRQSIRATRLYVGPAPIMYRCRAVCAAGGGCSESLMVPSSIPSAFVTRSSDELLRVRSTASRTDRPTYPTEASSMVRRRSRTLTKRSRSPEIATGSRFPIPCLMHRSECSSSEAVARVAAWTAARAAAGVDEEAESRADRRCRMVRDDVTSSS